VEGQGVKSTHLEEAQVGTRVRVQVDYRDPQRRGAIGTMVRIGTSASRMVRKNHVLSTTAPPMSSHPSPRAALPGKKGRCTLLSRRNPKMRGTA